METTENAKIIFGAAKRLVHVVRYNISGRSVWAFTKASRRREPL